MFHVCKGAKVPDHTDKASEQTFRISRTMKPIEACCSVYT